MIRIVKIFIALAILFTSFSACKTKQKVTKIPGANVEATTTLATPSTTSSKTPTITPTVSSSTTNSSSTEITRNEKFSLADGETNNEALNKKYHVVVGSFKSQVNAKGLQSTLKSEGNNALVVVNEQGMFRVLIASFNEYAQARTRINQIIDRFPGAWVLVQK